MSDILFQTPFSIEQRLLFAFVSGMCFGFAMTLLGVFLGHKFLKPKDRK